MSFPECGKPGFDFRVGKIPWKREWQPTPVFLPGEFHGQRSLAGYGPQGAKSQTQLSDKHTHTVVKIMLSEKSEQKVIYWMILFI